MPGYLLDTNICSKLIKKCPAEIAAIAALDLDCQICISTITVTELEYGVSNGNSMDDSRTRKTFNDFYDASSILPFDRDAALVYGNVRKNLEIVIGKKKPKLDEMSMDILIISHAYSLDLTLISNDKNMGTLANILDIKFIDWSKLK